ncbi:hypothetical protein OGATHE_006208 [Ogataea polymorpha]|uniref:Uncharacterized protein n=1 Tax=Ogataea polymorpha TaxID=460523 RepID=A0A9P8NUJ4_9ASCO|nr:hypothetical protein OGATHE_006208 [Ogataea polymorpha]
MSAISRDLLISSSSMLPCWNTDAASLLTGSFSNDSVHLAIELRDISDMVAPTDVELVVPDKVGVIAAQTVSDERLVGLWNVEVGVSALVRQVELGNGNAVANSRHLGVHFHHLEQVVLHHISNDTDGIKISTSSLGSERLLEGDLDRLDEVVVPAGRQKVVGEPERNKVLHHLFPQVVVDSVQLVLAPEWGQLLLQRLRRGQIVAERFLDDDPCNTFVSRMDIPLQVGGHRGEH